MFGRSSYERSAANIGDHLSGIQNELAKIGSQASQQAANGASATAEQVRQLMATISPVLDDLAGMLRRNQSYAADRAAEWGRKAADRGSDAAQRMIAQTKDQPGLMLAVALGVGILFGLSTRQALK